MMKKPTQAGRIRREASAAQTPPKRLLVNKLVIQAVANKTKTKPRRKESGTLPRSHTESVAAFVWQTSGNYKNCELLLLDETHKPMQQLRRLVSNHSYPHKFCIRRFSLTKVERWRH